MSIVRSDGLYLSLLDINSAKLDISGLKWLAIVCMHSVEQRYCYLMHALL